MLLCYVLARLISLAIIEVMEPQDTIPNSIVKLNFADGTASMWESRYSQTYQTSAFEYSLTSLVIIAICVITTCNSSVSYNSY